MRAIDADALKNSVLKWLPPDPCGQEEKEYPFETDICVSMIQEIENAPTIEPQPKIIHCKDCKYSNDYCHCKYTAWWTNPDDFCSRAERREDALN